MSENRYTQYVTDKDLEQLKTYAMVLDEVTGYEYAIRVSNGRLVTDMICIGIEYQGESVSLVDGSRLKMDTIEISAIYPDGTTAIIDPEKLICATEFVGPDTTELEVLYIECDRKYSTIVPVTVTPFDPVTTLMDFSYSEESDGIYMITGWKGTYNGEPSTELILPGNSYIKL